MSNLNVMETEIEEIEEFEESSKKDYSKMNLNEKICYISKAVGKIGKKNVPGVNYKVATADLIIDPVKYFMDLVGVIVTPSITDVKITHDQEVKFETSYDENRRKVKVPIQLPNGELATKKTHLVSLTLKIVLENVHNPEERKEYTWFATGSNQEGDEAKGFGSAMTYGMKYFYRTLFNISGNDDPDEFIDYNILEDKVKNDINLIKEFAAERGVAVEQLENFTNANFEKKLEQITYKELNMMKKEISKKPKIKGYSKSNDKNVANSFNNNTNTNNGPTGKIENIKKMVTKLTEDLNLTQHHVEAICVKNLNKSYVNLNVEELTKLTNHLINLKKKTIITKVINCKTL